ncbi:MAG: cell division protein SepF [Actinomycetota bacterium]
MSFLRALRAYVGLGPDEEIEDRYLYELNTRRRVLDLDELDEDTFEQRYADTDIDELNIRRRRTGGRDAQEIDLRDRGPQAGQTRGRGRRVEELPDHDVDETVQVRPRSRSGGNRSEPGGRASSGARRSGRPPRDDRVFDDDDFPTDGLGTDGQPGDDAGGDGLDRVTREFLARRSPFADDAEAGGVPEDRAGGSGFDDLGDNDGDPFGDLEDFDDLEDFEDPDGFDGSRDPGDRPGADPGTFEESGFAVADSGRRGGGSSGSGGSGREGRREPPDGSAQAGRVSGEEKKAVRRGGTSRSATGPGGTANGAAVADRKRKSTGGGTDAAADSTDDLTVAAATGIADERDGGVVRSLDSMRAKPRTLLPESFADAKLVADEFKRKVPVLLNLQGLDRDLARRLIDFASGICYALDGSMEKIASQVFLLIPDGAEVSAEDRRRIEERGYAR